MSLSYAVVGEGRMGRAISTVADARGHRRVAVARCSAELDSVIAAAPHVAFEFTEPLSAHANVARLARAGIHVVCGTTGWAVDDEIRAAVDAGGAGLVVAPNYSLGVQLFLRLVRVAGELAAGFGGFDPAITEWHHRGKRDAPSGTARRMAALIRDVDPGVQEIVEGHHEGRPRDGSVQVVGLRVGEEPGRHQLVLDGRHDRIVLEHAARGREGFALGAVRVAEWLEGRRGVVELDRLIDERLGATDAGEC